MIVTVGVNGKIIPEDEICKLQISNERLVSIFETVKKRIESQDSTAEEFHHLSQD